MADDRAPQWFYEKIAEVTGPRTKPMSERELSRMLMPADGPSSDVVRAAAEILRLRAQLKAILHAPKPAGRKKRA